MYLRDMKNDDIDNMLEWMRDPSINCFFRCDFQHMERADVQAFIEKSLDKKNNIHLAVCDDNDEYQGTVSLKNIDNEKKEAEYAISLRSKAKHQGYGYFATMEMLHKAFNQMKLRRVYLNVLEENECAKLLYQKCGFQLIDNKRSIIQIRGVNKVLVWYEIESQVNQ